MKIIVQRVLSASVSIDSNTHAEIGKGILVLVGITHKDTTDTMQWICNKIVNLRIFPDEDGKMNKSVQDIGGSILLVPNFTLYGTLKKGFRPSYTDAAPPEISLPLFEQIISHLKNICNLDIKAGVFGADMKVSLINDGPVTVTIKKEAD